MVAGPRDVAESTVASKLYSTSAPTQLGQVVVNPDGSNIMAAVTVTADTEFPTAAALNGTWAKTTVTTISGAAIMANDGTNEVLIGGEATNGLDVDVTRVIPGTSATHLGKAIDSAAGATDTGVSFLAIRDDTLSALTPVDGDYVPLRTDSIGALWVNVSSLLSGEDQTNLGLAVFQKPVATSTYTWDADVSAAYEASSVTKASAGVVRAVRGYNSGPAQFIHVGNNASLPANGTAPVEVIYVGTGQNFSIDFGATGKFFSVGVTVWNSSTGPTKTIGAADVWFSIDFK